MATPKAARSKGPLATVWAAQSTSERMAEWVVLQLQYPGRELRPAGILLFDSQNDQLHLSLRNLVADENEEDLMEVWSELAEDFRSKIQELGGTQVLEWLEADASHVVQLSARRQIKLESADPSETLEQLFAWHVLAKVSTSQRQYGPSDRKVSEDQLRQAQKQVGPLPSPALQILSLLQNPNSHMSQIEQAISRDPVLTAHLVGVANLAAYNDPARTLFSAIQRLGVDTVQFQVMALTMKKAFSAPTLRTVWNHSVLAAQVARQLAQKTAVSPSEAGLLGLVHDIGQVVLAGLGDFYRSQLQHLREQGLTAVAAERVLCGKSHAELGADLLASWSLPSDMVRAVAAHHSSAHADSNLAALLYITEAEIDDEQDIYDIEKHRSATQRLQLQPQALFRKAVSVDPDLGALRFAAAG